MGKRVWGLFQSPRAGSSTVTKELEGHSLGPYFERQTLRTIW